MVLAPGTGLPRLQRLDGVPAGVPGLRPLTISWCTPPPARGNRPRTGTWRPVCPRAAGASTPRSWPRRPAPQSPGSRWPAAAGPAPVPMAPGSRPRCPPRRCGGAEARPRAAVRAAAGGLAETPGAAGRGASVPGARSGERAVSWSRTPVGRRAGLRRRRARGGAAGLPGPFTETERGRAGLQRPLVALRGGVDAPAGERVAAPRGAFCLPPAPRGPYPWPHFTGGETEAQEREGTCSGSQCESGPEPAALTPGGGRRSQGRPGGSTCGRHPSARRGAAVPAAGGAGGSDGPHVRDPESGHCARLPPVTQESLQSRLSQRGEDESLGSCVCTWKPYSVRFRGVEPVITNGTAC